MPQKSRVAATWPKRLRYRSWESLLGFDLSGTKPRLCWPGRLETRLRQPAAGTKPHCPFLSPRACFVHIKGYERRNPRQLIKYKLLRFTHIRTRVSMLFRIAKCLYGDFSISFKTCICINCVLRFGIESQSTFVAIFRFGVEVQSAEIGILRFLFQSPRGCGSMLRFGSELHNAF